MAEPDGENREVKNGGDSSRVQSAHDRPDGRPEPPARYRPGEQGPPYVPVNTPAQQASGDDPELRSTHNIILAATVMAIASLFIGGMLLSAAALALSVVGFLKSSRKSLETQGNRQPAWQSLKRRGFYAIVFSVLALALNIVFMALLYPYLVDAMETGDYSYLFGGGQTSSGSASSVWG